MGIVQQISSTFVERRVEKGERRVDGHFNKLRDRELTQRLSDF